MAVLIVLILVLAIVFYKYLTWNFDYWTRRGVNGPKPTLYAGNYPKTFYQRTSNLMKESTEIYRKYFRKYRFIGVIECREPKVLVLDPSLVADIYVKYFKNFGENLLRLTVDERTDPLLRFNPSLDNLHDWKLRRAELLPAYTALRVKTVYPVIDSACKQMTKFLNEQINSGQVVFTSKDISTRVIGCIICDILFGLDAKAFDKQSEFVENSINQFYSSKYDELWNVIYALFPFVRAIYPSKLSTEKFKKWFTDLYVHAVELRLQQNNSRDDYLDFLIDLKKRKNLPDYILQAHAYTLFIDGFETTSYLLSFALIFLADHKECQDKLRAEVNMFEDIGYEELKQMPYMDAFLNESARLAPAPFPICKICTESVELEDYAGHAVTIEKGIKVILSIDGLHSHPDYYPNPEQFDPERFKNADSAKKFKDAGAFQPFGNGPRSCIGNRYAMASMKAVICALVKNFELTTKAADESVRLMNTFSFVSGSHTKIQFKKLE